MHHFIKQLLNGEKVEWKTLGEAVRIKRGKNLNKKDIDTGKTPIVLYGQLYTHYGNYIDQVISFCDEERAKKACLLIKKILLCRLPVLQKMLKLENHQ